MAMVRSSFQMGWFPPSTSMMARRRIPSPIGLGMRRLAIIDVEGGNQPIWNEDRTMAIVCNGEIYNYQSLRAHLEQKGHRFRTHSDVEVILHLYEDCGDDCFAQLN